MIINLLISRLKSTPELPTDCPRERSAETTATVHALLHAGAGRASELTDASSAMLTQRICKSICSVRVKIKKGQSLRIERAVAAPLLLLMDV